MPFSKTWGILKGGDLSLTTNRIYSKDSSQKSKCGMKAWINGGYPVVTD